MSTPPSLAVHAARRLTFGATPAVVADVERQGLAAWVDAQLSGLPDLHGELAGLGPGGLPLPYAVLNQLDGPQRDLLAELRQATFARAAWGDAQLAELLVELWTNHLSIAGDAAPLHKVVDDRDVVRRHALGSFSDLLVASAHSPAMLLYLDNASSQGAKPNENYARELLELHTVGVHGGYRQRDVRDAAKVLTGLTVEQGEFAYRAEWHATGAVRVLGWSHPNDDAAKGDAVATSMLRYLASHPQTATHLATKVVRRFVADDPPASLVRSAARVYLDGGTQIVPVVRHVVLSREFAAAAGHKVQRGLEWAAMAVRGLRLQQDPRVPVSGSAYVSLLGTLGQVPFGWFPPDGYPDILAAWSSTASVLARWNAAQQLVAGQVKGLQPLDVDALVGTPVPTTTGALVDRLVTNILCVPPSARTRRALVRSTGLAADRGVDRETARRLTPSLAALVLSSPEAQVR